MLELNKIYFEDCLTGMQQIDDKSIDMILCDLPYGTTACPWDVIIPFDLLWNQYKRIIKNNGCIALFGSEPFSSFLRLSNIKWFKYDWIWKKTMSGGFVHAKNKPLKKHEIISIFSPGTTVHKSQSKNRMTYNPQMSIGEPFKRFMKSGTGGTILHSNSKSNIDFIGKELVNDGTRYPISVIEFSNGNNHSVHHTQKPVDLCEYLIKTYTNENELVLDNCIGSGTTAEACMNTKRNFIGFENDPKYFEIANKRITNHILERNKNAF